MKRYQKDSVEKDKKSAEAKELVDSARCDVERKSDLALLATIEGLEAKKAFVKLKKVVSCIDDATKARLQKIVEDREKKAAEKKAAEKKAAEKKK